MENKDKNTDKCTCCPECGCEEYTDKNLIGDGYRVCQNCHQEWWVDIKYDSAFCRKINFEEILCKAFLCENKDDLQLHITLNPDKERIISAMKEVYDKAIMLATENKCTCGGFPDCICDKHLK